MKIRHILVAAAMLCLPAVMMTSCKKEPFQVLNEAVEQAGQQITAGSEAYDNEMMKISEIKYDEVDNTVKMTVTGGRLMMDSPLKIYTLLCESAPELAKSIEDAKANLEVTYAQPDMPEATLELTYDELMQGDLN